MDGRNSAHNAQFTFIWEDTLRDNLLNFAGTPKGVLLLQQTGAMNECVSYMHSRYARKLQVSFNTVDSASELRLNFDYIFFFIPVSRLANVRSLVTAICSRK